jgi:acyl carrier protein
MTQQDILNGLATIVNEIAGVPVGDVKPEKNFIDDLDVDSLAMVEIATAAEDHFGVRIPDDDLKDLRTVGDAVNYIEKAGVAV